MVKTNVGIHLGFWRHLDTSRHIGFKKKSFSIRISQYKGKFLAAILNSGAILFFGA
jgi:hypothetical protein